MTEPVKQKTEIKQGCRLDPHLFNGIIAYISEEKPHIRAVEEEIISALSAADNLATRSFPLIGLLKGMD